jgi:hypothetical protein
MENEITATDGVIWDTQKPIKRSCKGTTSVRIAKYGNNTVAVITFGKEAIHMLLGNRTSGSIMLGLDTSAKILYIKPCHAEENGARLLTTEKKQPPKLAVRWIGDRLGVTDDIVFVGDLVMKHRDMFTTELTKMNKERKGPKKNDQEQTK